tara:strand:+ start:2080 stop:2274 length:195 start_codon:yes stop_codon:yes gene_type:complete
MPKHSSEFKKAGKVMKTNANKKTKSSGKSKKSNPWMAHVAKVRAKNKGKSLKEILVMAKKSYKK